MLWCILNASIVKICFAGSGIFRLPPNEKCDRKRSIEASGTLGYCEILRRELLWSHRNHQETTYGCKVMVHVCVYNYPRAL